MIRRKRVAVFTGTRADYGLLVPLLRRLEQAENIDLRLLVSGSHLSLLHGMTIDAIIDDGFEIEARVETLLAADTPTATIKSIGLGLIDLAVRFDQIEPDLLVILGDRYEILAAALAAVISNVPVAHIHGGEVTSGAFDDSIRHAVTKLSHLHFVATEEFAVRVAQLGEQPEHIHVVGAPALDVIASMTPSSRTELSEEVGLDLAPPLVVLAYHPSTIPGEDPFDAIEELLAAMIGLAPGSLVLSMPNADPKFAAIRFALQNFAADHPWAVAVASLPHRHNLSLLGLADLVVGNSSSGVIEAPVLGTPVVNVGHRQDGRPMAEAVTSVLPERGAILDACRLALTPEMREQAREGRSPYESGVSVASAIVEAIQTTDLSGLSRKNFVDY